jgi:L-fucose/D-arabinose isomerase
METAQPGADRPRIAVVTFTDMRDEGISSEAVERHLRDRQEDLAKFLSANGVEAVDPLRELRAGGSPWYGIRSFAEIDLLMGILGRARIDGVIIGSWTWSPPMLVKELVRKVNRPILYYTENDPMGGSLSQMTATCASLMEWSVNRYALIHERCFGDRPALLTWARGVHAAARMRESSAMLWGGTYAVRMEQLQDDIPLLKSFMIRDVLQEDQYVLIKRAEEIIRSQAERIRRLYDWMTGNGLQIIRDQAMVTHEALAKQGALLLAARDRLKELASENIRGVSIKCQPEIYAEWGVNACTLPALLPFAENEEGAQSALPTVCEGDLKGLLTSMLFHAVNPGVPPVFGDLVSVGEDHVEFANCGAGSVFWAANSARPADVFSRVKAVANIHGRSGAAYEYAGVAAPTVTVGRLTRINGRYYMQLGEGRELDAREFLSRTLGDREPAHLAGTWGKVIVNLGVDPENFVRVIGANHLSATLGDVTAEVETACRLWGIPVVRLDSDESMERFYRDVRTVGLPTVGMRPGGAAGEA